MTGYHFHHPEKMLTDRAELLQMREMTGKRRNLESLSGFGEL